MNNNTVLAIAFLITGTLLTTTALTIMVPAAYAGGDNNDGNQQKAEDESQAALTDCDENDVKRAGFDCIAIAESEIETQEEEPPEESGTLFVCKEVENPPPNIEPFDFEFIVTGPGGFNSGQFTGGPIDDPDPDCPPGSNQPGEVAPGEYEIMETDNPAIPTPNSIEITGDCVDEDPADELSRIATVEIQEGETLTCTFTNIYEIDS
jgi:hypothetical protein